MANTSKSTPEKRAEILEALEQNATFTAACRKARIDRTTLYLWRKQDPAFDAEVLAARERGLDAIEDALVTRAKKNDTTAAIFLLKSHRREVYGDKVETTHKGTIKHAHHDMSRFTDEEVASLAAIAERIKAGTSS